MTKSAHTHVTPDLPPTVKVPEISGRTAAPSGERGAGDPGDGERAGDPAAARDRSRRSAD